MKIIGLALGLLILFTDLPWLVKTAFLIIMVVIYLNDKKGK